MLQNKDELTVVKNRLKMAEIYIKELTGVNETQNNKPRRQGWTAVISMWSFIVVVGSLLSSTIYVINGGNVMIFIVPAIISSVAMYYLGKSL